MHFLTVRYHESARNFFKGCVSLHYFCPFQTSCAVRLRVADETKQLQQSTSRRDRVMEDICVLEQNKAALDRKIADLTASLSTTEVTLAQLEAQLAELERTRSAKEAEVQNRAGVIATIKARIASRKSDQETMSKFVEQRDVINKAIQEAEQEMARCTSESDAMRQRIDSMKTQRKTMEKETIEVEAKLNEVEKTIEQVESELGSLPSEETLTSQVAAAQSRIDALSAQTGQTSADSVSVLLCKLEALSEEVTAVGDQGMKDIATQMEKLVRDNNWSISVTMYCVVMCGKGIIADFLLP